MLPGLYGRISAPVLLQCCKPSVHVQFATSLGDRRHSPLKAGFYCTGYFRFVARDSIVAMSTNQKLSLFDIYAGIGGFSLALQPEFQTVAYCEKEPAAVAVLEKNMRSGLLDKAPLYSDVLKLTEKDIRRHKPFIISMGFPCQDISLAQKCPMGITGMRSGTMLHVINIVRNASFVRMLLLENSPAVRMRGLDVITKELNAAGFKLSWGVFGACDVGSPQRRYRWFGVAYRDAKDLARIPRMLPPSAWKKEPKLCKVVPKSHAVIARLELLGNAVVPACARLAFTHIIASKTPGAIPYRHSCSHLPIITLRYPDGEVAQRLGWSTPVKTQNNHCLRMTKRCNQLLLGNVVYDISRKHCCDVQGRPAVNPIWVEWLQGYPHNYTST